jgi:hypothetical protein
MPTSIDTNAEPVLSLLYLFILFSSLLSISGAPLPAPHSPIEDRRPVSRRPSGILAPDQPPLVLDGSTVASMANRPP